MAAPVATARLFNGVQDTPLDSDDAPYYRAKTGTLDVSTFAGSLTAQIAFSKQATRGEVDVTGFPPLQLQIPGAGFVSRAEVGDLFITGFTAVLGSVRWLALPTPLSIDRTNLTYPKILIDGVRLNYLVDPTNQTISVTLQDSAIPNLIYDPITDRLMATADPGVDTIDSIFFRANVSDFTRYSAAARIADPNNAIPAALAPLLSANDTYGQDAAVIPAGGGVPSFQNFGAWNFSFTENLPERTLYYDGGSTAAQIIGAPGTAAGAVFTAPVPAGAVGRLGLFFAAIFGSGDTVTTPPGNGWVALATGHTSLVVYAKVLTAGDTSVSLTWNNGTNDKRGWVVALACNTGFGAPALVGPVANNTNASLTPIQLAPLLPTVINTAVIQLALKLYTTGSTAPITSITNTAGYTSLGQTWAPSSGVILVAQLFNVRNLGDPSVGTGVPTNNLTVVGNSEAGGQRRVTFAVKGVVSAGRVRCVIPMRAYVKNGVGDKNYAYNLVANPY